jgi:hypothetical protein
MNIENNNDLFNFIEKERKNINIIDNKKIIEFFYRCLIKTIQEIHEKFINIDDNIKNVYIGSNIVFNVFWILLNYTNNLTLTIFLSERSILLFSEFIILSRDPKINKDLCYAPNLSDAINFAYKKTIGPIKVSSLSTTNNSIKNLCFIIKEIIQGVYINYNNITYYKEDIIIICDKMYKINKLFEDDKIFFLVLKKIDNTNYDINFIKEFIDFLIANKHSKIKLIEKMNEYY